jgi:hypothetical protein
LVHFSGFGIPYQEKSGNPAWNTQTKERPFSISPVKQVDAERFAGRFAGLSIAKHLVGWAKSSVTRLGEISPFGRYFLALGAFFSEKYRPNDLGAIFFKKIAQNSP